MLAKLYSEHARGHGTAIGLLKKAISMSCGDINEEDKLEAASLLKRIEGGWTATRPQPQIRLWKALRS
jgi:hypothetical protein